MSGKRMKLTMSHFWPVRKPRPVAEKLAGEEALITGQRVIDVLYPYAPGPRAPAASLRLTRRLRMLAAL